MSAFTVSDMAVCGFLFFAIGCSEHDPHSPASPSRVLVTVDSVILEESASTYVGQPTDFAAAAEGYYVADARVGFVHFYSPDGDYIRAIGKRGSGPGEFVSGPNRLLYRDGLLVVEDGAQLKAIDAFNGKHLWSRNKPPGLSHPMAFDGSGRIMTNEIRSDSRTSIASFASATDSAVRTGPFPWPLSESEAVAEYFSLMRAATQIASDRFAVVFQSSDFVYIGRFGSSEFDSVAIPVINRRGTRKEVLQKIASNPMDLKIARELIYAQSIPWAWGWLGDGNLAYVSTDLDLVSGSRFQGKLFVSVIDPRTGRVCPDIPIPAPIDPHPVATFSGDTLLVLAQDFPDQLRNGEANTITYIRRFLINADQCSWIGA